MNVAADAAAATLSTRNSRRVVFANVLMMHLPEKTGGSSCHTKKRGVPWPCQFSKKPKTKYQKPKMATTKRLAAEPQIKARK